MFDTILKVALQTNDRRAAAYLLLVTRFVALAPMAIFLADRALFVSLDTGKLLLLAAALSFPALLVGVVIHLRSAEMEEMDRRVMIGIILASVLLAIAELIALVYIWAQSKRSLVAFVIAQGLALVVMLYVEFDEWRTWRKTNKLGADAASVDELRDFARAQPGRFVAWRRDRAKRSVGTPR